MKVAIVHEWLVSFSGSERVLEQLLELFPSADLFCVCDFLPEEDRRFLRGRSVKTTFIQGLPFARRSYRRLLPLMPLAIEQLDLSSYDLVLSSSHAVAKGVLTGPDQVHISYVHSPVRYAWDLQHQYLKESRLDRGLKGLIAKWLLHKFRLWDSRTANGVDRFVANSNFIARRIKKVYGRQASVVYPPVAIQKFHVHPVKEEFYLAASRMVPYKRMDLIAEAFTRMPERQLVIVGDGPELAKVRGRSGKNVSVLGYQTNDALHDLMSRARAFVFAAEEDFGIAPVEAQACGTPVIAYGKGGALETVLEGRTGIFFDNQTVPAIVGAVESFERSRNNFDPLFIRSHAERFSEDAFANGIMEIVQEEIGKFGKVMNS